jgi:uncharacterized membrane protein
MDFWLGGNLGAGGDLIWAAPPWQLGLGVGLAVVAWIAALVTGSGTRAQRTGEMTLWALALATLVVAIAEPTWLEESGRLEDGRVVVLIDSSASMDVREDNTPRSAAVEPILEQVTAAIGDVEVFSFDEAVHSGRPSSYQGRGTDVGVALSAVADRYLGQQLRGVVLISDGIDRGGLRSELAGASAPEERVALVPELPGPLTVYQAGSEELLHDVSITEVITGGFAFLRTPFTLTAKLRGPAGATLPVTLNREGRLVAEQDVTLDEEGKGTIDFKVVPKAVGRFAWELSVPIDPDDAVPGNNNHPVVVRVVRDRTRVLQVSGSPSYDQKFLRLFLKEDPSVDLVSFFILRTREDFGAGWSSDELSLIAFPYQRLFSEDLDTFDLVILQNFNYRPYFDWDAPQLLENIAQYVRDGGALVMTGGDRSFDLGEYGNTPIAGILPVRLGVNGTPTDEAKFLPTLSAAGRSHPIIRISNSVDDALDTWGRLPEMDGFNYTGGLVPGAAVLLEHPTATEASGEPVPILAVREVERGRVMSLAVDASWRWSFSEAAEGRGNQAYLRFWKNALRWLVADPEDRRVVVVPSRENVLLGDEVRLTIKVRNASYGPVPGRTVKGIIAAPDGSTTAFEVVSGPNGEATTSYVPSIQGAHRVKVNTGESIAERGETVFAVSSRDPELLQIVPDTRFLTDLAAAYGPSGRFYDAGRAGAPLLDDGAERLVPERNEVQLSSAPLLGLLFGLLSSLAWWIRRRGGGR